MGFLAKGLLGSAWSINQVIKLKTRDLPICLDKAECAHKGDYGKLRGKCLIDNDIPNGLHNDCKAKVYPNGKVKVTFT